MPRPDGEPDDGAMVRSLFDYLKVMRRGYLWNRVFGLVIRSLGKVVEV